MSLFQRDKAFASWKPDIALEGRYAKYLGGGSKNLEQAFFGFIVDQLRERV